MRLQSHDIIHRELEAFQQGHPVPTAVVSHRVGQLLKRIHADLFDTNLSVKTLKGRCRISDNNVSCRFKYEMGMSIKDYVETMRLDAAQHLLETGRYTAFEVGQALGYCNAQTFYRAFARRFHCTPGQMRMTGQSALIPIHNRRTCNNLSGAVDRADAVGWYFGFPAADSRRLTWPELDSADQHERTYQDPTPP